MVAQKRHSFGGLIGYINQMVVSGARMLLDLYKQVTRTADGYRAEGLESGMMMDIGGSVKTITVFIVGKE